MTSETSNASSVPTPEELDELRSALSESSAIASDPAQQQVFCLTTFFRAQHYPTPWKRALSVPAILRRLVNERLISEAVAQVVLEQQNAIVARLQDEDEGQNQITSRNNIRSTMPTTATATAASVPAAVSVNETRKAPPGSSSSSNAPDDSKPAAAGGRPRANCQQKRMQIQPLPAPQKTMTTTSGNRVLLPPRPVTVSRSTVPPKRSAWDLVVPRWTHPSPRNSPVPAACPRHHPQQPRPRSIPIPLISCWKAHRSRARRSPNPCHRRNSPPSTCCWGNRSCWRLPPPPPLQRRRNGDRASGPSKREDPVVPVRMLLYHQQPQMGLPMNHPPKNEGRVVRARIRCQAPEQQSTDSPRRNGDRVVRARTKRLDRPLQQSPPKRREDRVVPARMLLYHHHHHHHHHHKWNCQ